MIRRRMVGGDRNLDHLYVAILDPQLDLTLPICFISVGQVAGTDTCLFGVIDGHGGWQCAHAIKHRLPYYIALYLLDDAELTWRKPMSRHDWVRVFKLFFPVSLVSLYYTESESAN